MRRQFLYAIFAGFLLAGCSTLGSGFAVDPDGLRHEGFKWPDESEDTPYRTYGGVI